MFVGHYAISLALKGAEKKASLGMLFLAVQFIDILFYNTPCRFEAICS